MTNDLNHFFFNLEESIKTKTLNDEILNKFSAIAKQISENPSNDQIDLLISQTVKRIMETGIKDDDNQVSLFLNLFDSLKIMIFSCIKTQNKNLLLKIFPISDIKNKFYNQNSLYSKIFYDVITNNFIFNLPESIQMDNSFFVPIIFLLRITSNLQCYFKDINQMTIQHSIDFVIEFMRNVKIKFNESDSLIEIMIQSLTDIINSNKSIDLFSDGFLMLFSNIIKTNSNKVKIQLLDFLGELMKINENNENSSQFFIRIAKYVAISPLDLNVLDKSKAIIGSYLKSFELKEIICFYKNTYNMMDADARKIVYSLLIQVFGPEIPKTILDNIENNAFKIEFLCLILEGLLKADICDEFCYYIIEQLRYLAENYPKHLIYSFTTFFNILKIGNNREIIKFQIKALNLYNQVFQQCCSFKICDFLNDRLCRLYHICRERPKDIEFSELQNSLDNIMNSIDNYLEKNDLTLGILDLLFTLTIIRNMNAIIDDPSTKFKVLHNTYCIPQYKYFQEYIFKIIMNIKDNDLLKKAVSYFSKFFTNSQNELEDFKFLYNILVDIISCIDESGNSIENQLKKRNLLYFLYYTILNIECPYQLEDFNFDGIKRLHYDEKKNKVGFEIYHNDKKLFKLYVPLENDINALKLSLKARIEMRQRRAVILDEINNFQIHNINRLNIEYEQDQEFNFYYSSPSIELYKNGFIYYLFSQYDSDPCSELTKIINKFLSFLPPLNSIIEMPPEKYLQELVDSTKNISKLNYLLRCIKHLNNKNKGAKLYFRDNFNQFWHIIHDSKLKNKSKIEVFYYLVSRTTYENNSNAYYYIIGRIFHELIFHQRKSYIISSKLLIKILRKYHINLPSIVILHAIQMASTKECTFIKDIFDYLPGQYSIAQMILDSLKNNNHPKILLEIIQSKVYEFENIADGKKLYNALIDNCHNCGPNELNALISILIKLFEKHEHNIDPNPADYLTLLGAVFRRGNNESAKLAFELFEVFYPKIDCQITQFVYEKIYNNFEQNLWLYEPNKSCDIVKLKNLNYICYATSLIQVLNRMPSFLIHLFESKEQKLEKLQWLFASLQMTNKTEINPEPFISSWCGWDNKPIEIQKQQDVNEFFQYLINDCPEKCQNIFKGSFETQYAFPKLEVKQEDFSSIQVETENFSTLYQALEAFSDPSELYTASSQLYPKKKIMKHPEILAIQPNRYKLKSNKLTKLHHYFEFPEKLNLKFLTKDNQDCNYILHSIICHYGNEAHGHYFAIIRRKYFEKFSDYFQDKISTDLQQTFQSIELGIPQKYRETLKNKIAQANSPNNSNIKKLKKLKSYDNCSEWVKISDSIIEFVSDFGDAFGGKIPDLDNPAEGIYGTASLIFYESQDHLEKICNNNSTVNFSNDDHFKKLKQQINKENEQETFRNIFFSEDIVNFLKKISSIELNTAFLHYIIMHAGSQFDKHINDFIQKTDNINSLDIAINNFDNFISIIQQNSRLGKKYTFFSDHMKIIMKQEKAIKLVELMLNYIINNSNSKQMIPELLLLVNEYFKNHVNPDLYPFNSTLEQTMCMLLIKIFNMPLDSSNLQRIATSFVYLLRVKKKYFKNVNFEKLFDILFDKIGSLNWTSKFFELKYLLEKDEVSSISHYISNPPEINNVDLAKSFTKYNCYIIAKMYPQKIPDIIQNISNSWKHAKLNKFIDYLNSNWNLDDPVFQEIFLSCIDNGLFDEGLYPVSIVLSLHKSSNDFKALALDHIVKNSKYQDENIYNFLLNLVNERQDEDIVLMCIKLAKYSFQYFSIEQVFDAIFQKFVQNPDNEDETILNFTTHKKKFIIKMFNAFYESIIAIDHSKITPIINSKIYLKLENIFQESTNFEKWKSILAE